MSNYLNFMLKKIWLIERTFAWFDNDRMLNRNYKPLAKFS